MPYYEAFFTCLVIQVYVLIICFLIGRFSKLSGYPCQVLALLWAFFFYP